MQKFPLADDQIIVAGVIDDLTGFVEHPEVVADRLENVARAVGDPRRVMAGTDCGFDTSAGMGRVTEDVVWAKLKAMADGARIASQRLGLAEQRRGGEKAICSCADFASSLNSAANLQPAFPYRLHRQPAARSSGTSGASPGYE